MKTKRWVRMRVALSRLIVTALVAIYSAISVHAHEPMDIVVDHPDLYRTGEDEGYIVYNLHVEGFTVEISLNTTDDFTAEDAKELTMGIHYLGRQLRDVKSAIPENAYNLLANRVLIEYEDRRIGFPTYYGGSEPTVELWGLEYHRDILDGPGGEYGNPNIILHELAHAWHDLMLENGFENSEIVSAYETAMDNYETEDTDGESYYWTTNHKEYFAEFTVMYYRSTWDKPNSRYGMLAIDRDIIRRMWETTDEE